MARKSKFSEEQRSQLVAQFDTAQDKTEFCEKNGVSRSLINSWRLAQNKAAAKPPAETKIMASSPDDLLGYTESFRGELVHLRKQNILLRKMLVDVLDCYGAKK